VAPMELVDSGILEYVNAVALLASGRRKFDDLTSL
jgi:hypothetical protein